MNDFPRMSQPTATDLIDGLGLKQYMESDDPETIGVALLSARALRDLYRALAAGPNDDDLTRFCQIRAVAMAEVMSLLEGRIDRAKSQTESNES